MSGPAFWESLVKAGRTIYFPNIPLRLVAPNPEGLSKGLNVVTFITVPSTSKVRAVPYRAASFLPAFLLSSPRTPLAASRARHDAHGEGVRCVAGCNVVEAGTTAPQLPAPSRRRVTTDGGPRLCPRLTDYFLRLSSPPPSPPPKPETLNPKP